MKDAATLLALAERVQALTGPDREVDARIWCEVGNELGFDDPPQRHRLMRPLQPRICIMGRWLGSALDKFPGDIEGVAHNWRVPSFTTSLDAAMMLVPEGAVTFLASQDRHSLRWKWELRHGYGIKSAARAETAALALTAACLRAHAAIAGEG